jgi:hypothetical protein
MTFATRPGPFRVAILDDLCRSRASRLFVLDAAEAGCPGRGVCSNSEKEWQIAEALERGRFSIIHARHNTEDELAAFIYALISVRSPAPAVIALIGQPASLPPTHVAFGGENLRTLYIHHMALPPFPRRHSARTHARGDCSPRRWASPACRSRCSRAALPRGASGIRLRCFAARRRLTYGGSTAG